MRSIKKCCYHDIEEICLNPAFELRGMTVCNPETCDLYYEAAWYMPIEYAELRRPAE